MTDLGAHTRDLALDLDEGERPTLDATVAVSLSPMDALDDCRALHVAAEEAPTLEARRNYAELRSELRAWVDDYQPDDGTDRMLVVDGADVVLLVCGHALAANHYDDVGLDGNVLETADRWHDWLDELHDQLPAAWEETRRALRGEGGHDFAT